MGAWFWLNWGGGEWNCVREWWQYCNVNCWNVSIFISFFSCPTKTLLLSAPILRGLGGSDSLRITWYEKAYFTYFVLRTTYFTCDCMGCICCRCTRLLLITQSAYVVGAWVTLRFVHQRVTIYYCLLWVVFIQLSGLSNCWGCVYFQQHKNRFQKLYTVEQHFLKMSQI